MADPDPVIADLERRLALAVGSEDFETAAELREAIAVLREVPGGSKLRRQEPGRMGLGTSQTAHVPPKGWTAPKKPPPLTGNHKPRGGGRG